MLGRMFVAIIVFPAILAVAQAAESTEKRDVSGFSKLDLRSAANVEIEIGKPEALEISARPDLLDDITAEVENGTLVIKQRWEWGAFGGPSPSMDANHDGKISRAESEAASRAFFDRADANGDGELSRAEIRNSYRHDRDDDKVTIRISLPRLDAMSLTGAGQIVIKGFAGGDTSVVLGGAGGVKASGRLDSLSISLNGAGNIDFGGVHAKSANVMVNGTGSVSVDASDAIKATVNGVGSIIYSGNPKKISTAVHGVGSIRHKS